MEYLSGLDNLFLMQETDNQHMHVGGLGIYDQSTAEGGSVRFKSILDFFTTRFSEAPIFRRRLVESPLSLDRPAWISEPHVDVEYHVHHLALPAPGDWRQLMIQVARLHARPLDLSKPLWEAYIIEGLDNIEGLRKGCFALYLKFHHAAIDGESAAYLIGSLHTPHPEFEWQTGGRRRTIKVENAPGVVELLANSAGNKTRQLFEANQLTRDLAKFTLEQIRNSGNSQIKDLKQTLLSKLNKSDARKPKRPATRFNRKISPHRALDALELPLDEFQRIREQVPGATINDIFLTMVGGAIKSYLAEKGEAVDASLMGTMPITLRGEDKTRERGNQIAQAYYSLRTDVVDPIERLIAVNEETKNLKQGLQQGLGPDVQQRLLNVLPARLVVKPITQALGNNANVNISNVRGPATELYMAGARLEKFVPFSVIFDGAGLNITGFSYNGSLFAAVTCCREMLPDPANLTEHMRASFDEICKAIKPAKIPTRATAKRLRKTTRRKSSTAKGNQATTGRPGAASAGKSTGKTKTGTRKRRTVRKKSSPGKSKTGKSS